MSEHQGDKAPDAIKFDISDGYAGIETEKMMKISAVSDPKKTYLIEIDLADEKSEKIYETQMENYNRQNKFFKNDGQQQPKGVLLTDYTRGAKDNQGVA